MPINGWFCNRFYLIPYFLNFFKWYCLTSCVDFYMKEMHWPIYNGSLVLLIAYCSIHSNGFWFLCICHLYTSLPWFSIKSSQIWQTGKIESLSLQDHTKGWFQVWNKWNTAGSGRLSEITPTHFIMHYLQTFLMDLWTED